ncbi:Na(+)/H(+) antiporter subunit B [bacterium]|nr:Na(+)/H(+) antiporter subunit B [bacterium]
MKRIGLIVVALTGILFIYGIGEFPAWSDPLSPASMHVSPYYIKQAVEETAVPNVVTAVLADYRSFDTMFETTVIFAAGLACFILLRKFEGKQARSRLFRHINTGVIVHIEEGGNLPLANPNFERIDSQWTPYDLIIKTTCRMVIPFLQIFALYVIAHGHHSPGGGFQGGVILGASIILFAISHDLRSTIGRLSEKKGALLSSAGVFLYAGTGMLCLLMGASFLDYSALADLLATDSVWARSHGILIVEVGVGLSVMAVMIWLYYNISSSGKHKEGL